jgi:hypothetical protein
MVRFAKTVSACSLTSDVVCRACGATSKAGALRGLKSPPGEKALSLRSDEPQSGSLPLAPLNVYPPRLDDLLGLPGQRRDLPVRELGQEPE